MERMGFVVCGAEADADVVIRETPQGYGVNGVAYPSIRELGRRSEKRPEAHGRSACGRCSNVRSWRDAAADPASQVKVSSRPIPCPTAEAMAFVIDFDLQRYEGCIP